MARPLRRVLIGLSIRLKLSLRELEQYDLATIRQYLAVLGEMSSQKKAPPSMAKQQTPEEMMAAITMALGPRH